MYQQDLFEKLRSELQCEYISDMRYSPWLEKARIRLAQMDLKNYSVLKLNEIAGYLYMDASSFSNREAVCEFIKSRCVQTLCR